MTWLKTIRIGFIGAGNMTRSLISAWHRSGHVSMDKIGVTNRSPGKLVKLQEEFGIQSVSNNEELILQSDVIIVSVKPQDLEDAIDLLAKEFTSEQIVVSLAAGVQLSALAELIPTTKKLVRVMPNTPAKLGQGVVGYTVYEGAESVGALVEDLLSPLGKVVNLDEGEAFEAFTVATSSGIGFIFELMIYWQEWLEEHGFSSDEAREMTVKTFLGASQLADKNSELGLQQLQDQVVSKKGVTFAGLESMRELDVNRLMRFSFEKAVLRDREFGGQGEEANPVDLLGDPRRERKTRVAKARNKRRK